MPDIGKDYAIAYPFKKDKRNNDYVLFPQDKQTGAFDFDKYGVKGLAMMANEPSNFYLPNDNTVYESYANCTILENYDDKLVQLLSTEEIQPNTELLTCYGYSDADLRTTTYRNSCTDDNLYMYYYITKGNLVAVHVMNLHKKPKVIKKHNITMSVTKPAVIKHVWSATDAVWDEVVSVRK